MSNRRDENTSGLNRDDSVWRRVANFLAKRQRHVGKQARRRLAFEPLESRTLLAGDLANYGLQEDTGSQDSIPITSNAVLVGEISGTVGYGNHVDVEFDHDNDGNTDGTISGLLQGGTFNLNPLGTDPSFADAQHTIRARAVEYDSNPDPLDPYGGLVNEGDWQSVTFILDRVGPSVQSFAPTDGQTLTEVPTQIVVTFDEAIDPASVTSSTVFVTGVPAAFQSVTMQGTTQVVVSLPSTLSDGDYTTTVTGVKDLAGHAVTAQSATWALSTNAAPTDINLDEDTVAENQASGTVVGNFSTTDPDSGDTHTYTLVSGTGDTDNGSFTVDGNQLKTNAVFDFETKSSYSIRVKSTDGGGESIEEVFTITVTDVSENAAPTDINLDEDTVAENQASGTVVGNFSTTDRDSGDTHTYTLVTGTGDTDNGAFTIDGNQLKTNAVFDFETKSSYSIRVKSTDGGGESIEEVFTITVTDVSENAAPTDINLDEDTVAENQASGTVVGNFSTTDPDSGDTHTYTLVSGTGDTDNGSFTVDGNQLKTNAVFDFETKSSYSIRVKSTDSGGESIEEVFTITVTDVNEAPTATDATFELDENAANGDAVGTVEASDPDSGDTLTFEITSGNDDGAFSINTTSGQISVADATKIDNRTLTVKVTDGGSLTDDASITIQVNSLPQISIGDVDVVEGIDANAEFTVTLSEASSETVQVDYFTSNDSDPNTADATENVDYTPTFGTLTFASGETSKTVSVPINNDAELEGIEYFAVQLTSPINATLQDDEGQGSIKDYSDPSLPVVSIEATDPSASDLFNNEDGEFTISVSGDLTSEITVYYAVTGSAVMAGTSRALSGGERRDYARLGNTRYDRDANEMRGSVTFTPGSSTSHTITVDPKRDRDIEGIETVVVTLLEDAETQPAFALATDAAEATVEISDLEVELKVEFVQVEQAGFGELRDDNPDGELDENGQLTGNQPAFGGGHRFFPGAKLNDGGERFAHNAVRVVVTIDITNLDEIKEMDPDFELTDERYRVWFKSFDVDDPSKSESIDTNDYDGQVELGDRGNDNRGRLAGTNESKRGQPGDSEQPTEGGFSGLMQGFNRKGQPKKNVKDDTAWSVIEQEGDSYIAKANFYTSFAPGDNFRIGAQLGGNKVPSELDSLKNGSLDINKDDDVPVKDKEDEDGTENLQKFRKAGGQLSKQLAVWRKMHMEVDTMGKIPEDHRELDKVTGIVKTVAEAKDANGQVLAGKWEVSIDAPVLRDNGYVGGILRMGDKNYDVLSNRLVESDPPVTDVRIGDFQQTLLPRQTNGDWFFDYKGTVPVDGDHRAPQAGDTIWVSPNFTENGYFAPYLIKAVVRFNNETRFAVTNPFGQPDPTALFDQQYLFPDGKTFPNPSARATFSSTAQKVIVSAEVRPEIPDDMKAVLYEDDFHAEGDEVPTLRLDPSQEQYRTAALQFMQTTTDRTKNRFADAYIEPEYQELQGQSGSFPADPHLTFTDRRSNANVLASNAGARLETDVYWVARIVMAYQPAIDNDGDPNLFVKDPISNQIELGGASTQRGHATRVTYLDVADQTSYVWLETIRDDNLNQQEFVEQVYGAGTTVADFETIVGYVAAHEVGHQFGLVVGAATGHREGENLMDDDGSDGRIEKFGDEIPGKPFDVGSLYFDEADIGSIRSQKVAPGKGER